MRWISSFRRRGRTFTDRDVAGAPPVTIINEAMARQFWKDGNPLSDRIVIGRARGCGWRWSA